jgi:hypothetical protein
MLGIVTDEVIRAAQDSPLPELLHDNRVESEQLPRRIA